MRVLLLFLCLVQTVAADVFHSERELLAFSNEVMSLVGNGNVVDAIAKMQPYMTVPAEQVQNVIRETRESRRKIAEIVGPSIGYEYIGQKRLGASLLRTVYIEKTKNTPIAWIFVFYHSIEGWKLSSFTFEIDSHIPFNFAYD